MGDLDKTAAYNFEKPLWESALDTFSPEEAEVIRAFSNEHENVLETTLEAVAAKKEVCLRKRWRYRKNNGDVIIVRDLLDKVASCIHKFREIGDIVVQFDPVHAALPWAGVRLILQIAVSDSQTFGAMAEGVQEVADIITRYSIVENLYLARSSSIQPQLRLHLVRMYAAVFRYLLHAKAYYEKNTAGRMVSGVIHSTSEQIGKYLAEVNRARRQVDDYTRLADAENNNRLSKKLDNVLELQKGLAQFDLFGKGSLSEALQDLNRPLSRLCSDVSLVRDSLQANERRELLKWVSNIPVNAHHKNMVKDRLPNSGLWLTNKLEYVDWQNSSMSSVLWLHGIPGSGKSKLIATVIENLKEQSQSGDMVFPLAFFYCARNASEPQRADPEEVLRSLVKQLGIAGRNLQVKEPLLKVYMDRKLEAELDGGDPLKIDLDECVDVLLELTAVDHATIIIDALDECDPKTRYRLLAALDKIIQESSSLVKVIISSRDDNDILQKLKAVPNVYIRAADNSDDIARFVKTELDSAIQEGRLLAGNVSQDLRTEITKTLIAKSQGMFQWISLQLQNLCDVQRMKVEEDVRLELGKLPKTLGDLYAKILTQIKSSGPRSQEVAERTLKWLLCASRAMKSREFIAAVSTSPTGEHTRLAVNDIISVCCNLVVLDRELDVFRFAHLSVREFLEDQPDYSQQYAHELALIRCLDVFVRSTSAEPVSPDLSSDDSHIRSYATLHWIDHCEILTKFELSGIAASQLRRFLVQEDGTSTSKAFGQWVIAAKALFNKEQAELGIGTSKLLNLLSNPADYRFACCFLGLTSYVRAFAPGYDLNSLGNFNQDGFIHVATKRGHLFTVKSLIERGAGVSTRNSESTPLHMAVQNNDFEMVQLLLENGALVEAIDDAKRTPLFIAASNGDEHIAATLIEKGASVHTLGHDFWNPLHAAADNGHLGVVKLLLKSGANIDDASHRGLTALSRAAGRGYYDIVSLLIKSGANVDVKTLDRWTPLHSASSGGHVATMRLLLSKGADINQLDSRNGSVLHKACLGHYSEAVAFLLSQGAPFTGKDLKGRIPLHYAAIHGYRDLISRLLENDEAQKSLQLSSKDSAGDTPADLAFFYGHLQLSRYLREHVNPRISELDPLDLAIETGDTSRVFSLISEKEDLDELSSDGLSILHRAAWFDLAPVISEFLKRGADIERKTQYGFTPLHIAAMRGCEEAFKTLHKLGADPKAQTLIGASAFIKACAGGSETIVRLMVDQGLCELQERDATGKTPLHHAAEAGKENVVRYLISKGAAIDVRDKERKTPQSLASEASHRQVVEILRLARHGMLRSTEPTRTI